ncbi:hypothetical protein TNIN_4891 [Trichonephila inaurata madagascariensis]|uniref:Uncharacterized protein n=1 Tax=Trichonephila inaurata madagascariensis TaxID=2747483 RepID=A0A8X6YIG6_9ARAC|nr:hypothetical protein TNIN_4891 [Trichonephila inaurata madagascariensis]
MKSIEENLYLPLLVLDIGTVDEFVKRCRHMEGLRRCMIPTRFQKLPNVPVETNLRDISFELLGHHLMSLIREIMIEEPGSILPEIQCNNNE